MAGPALFCSLSPQGVDERWECLSFSGREYIYPTLHPKTPIECDSILVWAFSSLNSFLPSFLFSCLFVLLYAHTPPFVFVCETTCAPCINEIYDVIFLAWYTQYFTSWRIKRVQKSYIKQWNCEQLVSVCWFIVREGTTPHLHVLFNS